MKRQEVTVNPDAQRAWRSADVTVYEAGKQPKTRKKMSQKELGEAAGVSAALIALIETGDRQPSLSNAISIAKALGVPLKAFATVHIDLDSLMAEQVA